MRAAVYLSVVTQKLRLRLRMCVAHVSYIYLIHTYINIYTCTWCIYKPHELSDPQSETQLLRDHRQVHRCPHMISMA